MRRNAIALAVLVGAVLTPMKAEAAQAVNCVDQYLGCINEASQEEGALWRTAKEVECGVDYYACMRQKITGY